MRYHKLNRVFVYVLICFVLCFIGLQFLRSVKNVPVITESEASYTLILDPGHGGEDGGTVGVSGTREADVNLAVSKKLRDLLLLLGYRSVMTRTEDHPVGEVGADTVRQRKINDLKNRAVFVNETRNPVLISIHQNYYSDSRYCGAQVFYAKGDSSQFLAQTLQNSLVNTLDSKNHRQPKPSERVYLMEHISCPAVILECGFLSNYTEEQKLIQTEYQQKIAAATAQAILFYLQGGSTIA